MRRAFTLLEVNLAIMIMSTGVLIVCALYSLGFRENRQSVEDVCSVSYADAYLGPLVQGLSATNFTWSAWKRIGERPNSMEMRKFVDGIWPRNGWSSYVQRRNNNSEDYRVIGSPRGTADRVFSDIISKVPSEFAGSKPNIPSDFEYALVATRHGAVIQLAFRATQRKNALMAQPVFVSEVHFQGDPNQ